MGDVKIRQKISGIAYISEYGASTGSDEHHSTSRAAAKRLGFEYFLLRDPI